MRLIDADDLKENEPHYDEEGYRIFYESEIDNAPTVDRQAINAEWLKVGIDYAETHRPQGEWEEPFERSGKTYHKCSYCHISSELILIGNFCPNCGAKMKGGEE
jgi:hypothetical protein